MGWLIGIRHRSTDTESRQKRALPWPWRWRWLWLLVWPWLPALPVTAQDTEDQRHVLTPTGLSESAQSIVAEFSRRLRSELQRLLETGNPVDAIKVCRQRAPAIAADLSTDGWHIQRVSIRPRNPQNVADNFERSTLLDFEEKKAQGWNVERLAYYKMHSHQLGDHTVNEFHYIKAIPARKLCLTCHGENIAPKIQGKLATLYPRGKAPGYQLNDILGAFSLRRSFISESEKNVPMPVVAVTPRHTDNTTALNTKTRRGENQ